MDQGFEQPAQLAGECCRVNFSRRVVSFCVFADWEGRTDAPFPLPRPPTPYRKHPARGFKYGPRPVAEGRYQGFFLRQHCRTNTKPFNLNIFFAAKGVIFYVTIADLYTCEDNLLLSRAKIRFPRERFLRISIGVCTINESLQTKNEPKQTNKQQLHI